MLIIGVIIRIIIMGFLFWGVMKLFDRDNTRNTLTMAFLTGLLLSFGGYGFFGLVFLGILLVTYYEMGFMEMILFLIVLFAVSWGVGYLFSLAF